MRTPDAWARAECSDLTVPLAPAPAMSPDAPAKLEETERLARSFGTLRVGTGMAHGEAVDLRRKPSPAVREVRMADGRWRGLRDLPG